MFVASAGGRRENFVDQKRRQTRGSVFLELLAALVFNLEWLPRLISELLSTELLIRIKSFATFEIKTPQFFGCPFTQDVGSVELFGAKRKPRVRVPPFPAKSRQRRTSVSALSRHPLEVFDHRRTVAGPRLRDQAQARHCVLSQVGSCWSWSGLSVHPALGSPEQLLNYHESAAALESRNSCFLRMENVPIWLALRSLGS